MVLVFFVGKKNKEKRMIQDYWYFDEWTVKNNYPLPLISDIIKNIGTKKMFMKMDLRQGYNNIRIKERDKWKVAFTIPEGLFEPMVMFFGLTNSLATFQTIINKLLRGLINIGKVESFIDNIMVRTESKKGYNKLVEKILQRLKKNNLYIKSEKYRQRVGEVDFLGIVIRPKEIKIEEVKVKAEWDWPVPKLVKDVQKFLGLANYYKKFVEEFAKIAKLLHELTKKKQK